MILITKTMKISQSSNMFGGSVVKHPPAMQETQVRFLGQEDPLEKGMATHSSILSWRIPLDRGVCRARVLGVEKELDTTL